MSHSIWISHHVKPKLRTNLQTNIFSRIEDSQMSNFENRKFQYGYDLVGSKKLRQSILSQNRSKNQLNDSSNNNKNNSQIQADRQMTSTVKRQTMLLSLQRHKKLQITKETRNLHRYKQYKNLWQIQSNSIRKSQSEHKRQTLLQNSIKKVHLQQNEEKQKVFNENIVKYWQMSLRNNNKALKKHLKNNNLPENKLQQYLQMAYGVKYVEDSIPMLPLKKLRQTNPKQLLLTGRSTNSSDNYKQHSLLPTNTSHPLKDKQDQIYKINYSGNNKWQNTEGL